MGPILVAHQTQAAGGNSGFGERFVQSPRDSLIHHPGLSLTYHPDRTQQQLEARSSSPQPSAKSWQLRAIQVL